MEDLFREQLKTILSWEEKGWIKTIKRKQKHTSTNNPRIIGIWISRKPPKPERDFFLTIIISEQLGYKFASYFLDGKYDVYKDFRIKDKAYFYIIKPKINEGTYPPYRGVNTIALVGGLISLIVMLICAIISAIPFIYGYSDEPMSTLGFISMFVFLFSGILSVSLLFIEGANYLRKGKTTDTFENASQLMNKINDQKELIIEEKNILTEMMNYHTKKAEQHYNNAKNAFLNSTQFIIDALNLDPYNGDNHSKAISDFKYLIEHFGNRSEEEIQLIIVSFLMKWNQWHPIQKDKINRENADKEALRKLFIQLCEYFLTNCSRQNKEFELANVRPAIIAYSNWDKELNSKIAGDLLEKLDKRSKKLFV